MIDGVLTCNEDLSLCPFFQGLSRDDRDLVLRHIGYEHLDTGQALMREGDLQRGIHIVKSGRCEVVKQLAGGSEQQLAVLDSGAIVGEVSFFSRAAHSATIRAIEPVEAMTLSMHGFDALKRLEPSIAMTLMANMGRLLAERFRRMDQYTYDLFVRKERVGLAHHQEMTQDRYSERVASSDQCSTAVESEIGGFPGVAICVSPRHRATRVSFSVASSGGRG